MKSLENISFGSLVMPWQSVPYAELPAVLVWLRSLAMLHQTHHWISRGDSFYGDHLLFARLYDEIVSEIDTVAEKAVGLSTEQAVDVVVQAELIGQVLSTQKQQAPAIPNQNALIMMSLKAEMLFLDALTQAFKSLQNTNVLSKGIDNMLASIFDTHEQHVYLLKQRTKIA